MELTARELDDKAVFCSQVHGPGGTLLIKRGGQKRLPWARFEQGGCRACSIFSCAAHQALLDDAKELGNAGVRSDDRATLGVIGQLGMLQRLAQQRRVNFVVGRMLDEKRQGVVDGLQGPATGSHAGAGIRAGHQARPLDVAG